MNTGVHTSPGGGETSAETSSDSATDPSAGAAAGPAPESTADSAAERTLAQAIDETGTGPAGGSTAGDARTQAGGSAAGAPLDGETSGEDGSGEAGNGAAPGLDAPNDAEQGAEQSTGELHRQLVDAEARADENWDRLLRLQAEMENQRKRAQRDVTAARKFALEGIVGDLLPVRDSLEMGLSAAAEEGATIESIREGSELTLKMMATLLEKNNIVAIDPVGEKFNPEFHQAMTMQPMEGVAPNTVTSVMQKGYTLNERLIRPALVIVAK